jgi:hypothetical protein
VVVQESLLAMVAVLKSQNIFETCVLAAPRRQLTKASCEIMFSETGLTSAFQLD